MSKGKLYDTFSGEDVVMKKKSEQSRGVAGCLAWLGIIGVIVFAIVTAVNGNTITIDATVGTPPTALIPTQVVVLLPTPTLAATSTAMPTLVAQATAVPTNTAEPTHMPRPTQTAEPTHTPLPTQTAEPTFTPQPTHTPLPTQTAEPTHTPFPTATATAVAIAIPVVPTTVRTFTPPPAPVNWLTAALPYAAAAFGAALMVAGLLVSEIRINRAKRRLMDTMTQFLRRANGGNATPPPTQEELLDDIKIGDSAPVPPVAPPTAPVQNGAHSTDAPPATVELAVQPTDPKVDLELMRELVDLWNGIDDPSLNKLCYAKWEGKGTNNLALCRRALMWGFQAGKVEDSAQFRRATAAMRKRPSAPRPARKYQ